VLESYADETYRILPIPLVHVSQGGLIVEVGSAFCELLGYSRDELLGRSLVEFCPAGLAMTQIHETTLSWRPVRNLECTLRTKTGKDVLVLVSTLPRASERGVTTGYVAVFYDVTEQRRAEADLRASQELFALFMRFLPGCAYVKDAEGKIVFLNEEYERAFHIKLSDWLGKTNEEIFPPEVARALTRDDQQVLTEHKPLERIETIPQRDGPHVYATYKFPIEPAGKAVMLGGVSLDITALRQAQEGLTRLNTVLQAIRTVNQLIVREKDRTRLLEGICATLVQARGYLEAWIVLLDSKGRFVAATEAGMADRFPALLEDLKKGNLPACVEEAIGRPGVVVAKVETGTPPVSGAKTGSVPISLALRLEHEGRVHGVLVVSAPRDIPADAEEQDLLAALGSDIALALHLIELGEERARAQTELAATESRYRALVESVHDGVYTLDRELRFTFVNELVEQRSGRPGGELLGQSFLDVTRPEDRSWVKERLEAVLRGELIPPYELVYLRPTGEPFYVEVSAAPLHEGDRIIGLLGISRDISERKQAEEALRRERDRFERYLQVAQFVIVGIDANQQVSLINQQGCALVGYEEKEIVGRNWFDNFIPSSVRPGVKDAFQKLMAGDLAPVEYFENPVLTRGGEERTVAWHNTLLRDNAGRIVGTLSSGEDVTERREAEAALRESEERYRNLFENAPIGIYRTAPDGRILMASPALLRMLRFSSFGELAQRDLETAGFGPEYARQEFRERLERNGEVRGLEAVWICQDGARLLVRENARVCRDVHGKVLYYEGTVEDVTEHRQAQVALRESEEKYRNLVERANDGIVIIQDGVVRYVNPRLAAMWGGTVAEIVGARFTDFIHPDELPQVAERYRRRLAGESVPSTYETVLRRRDGSSVPVELNAGVITHAGQPGDLVIVRDITERKQTETEIRQLSDYLKAVNEFGLELAGAPNEADLYELITSRLKAVTGAVAVSVSEYDPVARDLRVRQLSVESGLLTQVNQILGQSLLNIRMPVTPEVYQAMLNVNTSTYDNLTDVTFGAIPREASTIIQKLLNVDTFVGLALIREQEVMGTAVITTRRDIPLPPREVLVTMATQAAVALRRRRAEETVRESEGQIRKLNQELEHEVRELEAALKELDAFAYSVSHDLRAPLRAIDGFSRILLEDYLPQLPPGAQRHLEIVRSNTQHMGKLIDDLLAFSRFGRQPLKEQPVNPASLVRQALERLRGEQGERRIAISIGDLPGCRADPDLLRQVFVNLLSNAIKFTRDQAAPQIEIGGQAHGNEVIYFVRDNGVGFDMQYSGKLFGVFQRLHRAEDYEGTGVGLAIVQRIVHRHGGRVWAEAAVDQGATFYFALKLTAKEP
jgi:PAS domain S-box-containing protein